MLRIEILLDKLIKEMRIKGINNLKYDSLNKIAEKKVAEDVKTLHRGFLYWKEDGALHIQASEPEVILEKKYTLNQDLCTEELLVFNILGDFEEISEIVITTNQKEIEYDLHDNKIYILKLSVENPIIKFRTTYQDNKVTHSKVLCSLRIQSNYKYISYTEDSKQINVITNKKMKRVEELTGTNNSVKKYRIYDGNTLLKFKIDSPDYVYHRNYIKKFDKSIYEYDNQIIKRWRYFNDEDEIIKQIKIARDKKTGKRLYNSKEIFGKKTKEYIRYDRSDKTMLRIHKINYENGKEIDRRQYVR